LTAGVHALGPLGPDGGLLVGVQVVVAASADEHLGNGTLRDAVGRFELATDPGPVGDLLGGAAALRRSDRSGVFVELAVESRRWRVGSHLSTSFPANVADC